LLGTEKSADISPRFQAVLATFCLTFPRFELKSLNLGQKNKVGVAYINR